MFETIKVLLVDDEDVFRDALCKILSMSGFEVIQAENGEAGIKKLEERPDIIVLDIKMPGMDGYHTLREIKKRCPDLPVIMLTAYDSLASIQAVYDNGATDCLTKPCDINLLTAKIRGACYVEQQKGDAGDTEKRVMGVMIPLKEYSVVRKDITVREAIQNLRDNFIAGISTNRIMETAHRSMLVIDNDNNVHGILTIRGLLEALVPHNDSHENGHFLLLWKGLFTRQVIEKADVTVETIMSPAPPTVDGGASLLEAAYLMLKENVRRLVVLLKGRPIGVVREQDLFFEMERILRK